MSHASGLDETKKNAAVNRNSVNSAEYLADNDSEETENSNASSSECDSNDIDKNNNDKSPALAQKFTLSQRSLDAPHTSYRQDHNSTKKSSTPSWTSNASSAFDDELTQKDTNFGLPAGVAPAMQEEMPRFPGDKCSSRGSGDICRANFSPVILDAREEKIISSYEVSPSLQPRANANENNNCNGKKQHKLHARSRAYEFRRNVNFREKSHSVQLSSIRASKGNYEASAIKPFKERMICKDGTSNVHMKKFSKIDWVSRYSRDIYTTLIDLSWTWVIFLTSVVYVGHWIIFGLIYWLFAFVNDDYVKIFGSNLQQETVANISETGYDFTSTVPPPMNNFMNEEPCVSQVYDFASAFLFSMESETTIGYGSRTMGTTCPVAVFTLIVQCVLSAIFDTWVIGMCFSRLARPDARSKTILYPRNAVICTRDGQKCLIVRVANLRKSLLLSVSCRAHVITLRSPKTEEEGLHFMLEQKELNFENSNSTMLTAPIEYCHVIDKDSPLHTIPEKCFRSELQNWFEVVIIVTGIVEATGMTMHAQTSYLSTEIKYKHRLVPVLSISPSKDRYVVDFKKFHETVPEPLEVEFMAASRQRKESKAQMKDRFCALAEESEDVYDDDVFAHSDEWDEIGSTTDQNPCCKKHSHGDNNMNFVCTRGNLDKNCADI